MAMSESPTHGTRAADLRRIAYYTVVALAGVSILALWCQHLGSQSLVVIYFGRPSDTFSYLCSDWKGLLVSSSWCAIVSVMSLILAGFIATMLLIAGLLFDGGVKAIERAAAALQTVPILVVVTVSLLVESEVYSVLHISPPASIYCLVPVTISLMFPPLANGAGAIRRLPIQLKEILRIWDAPPMWRILKVYIPWMTSDILTGVRASATWAVGATLIAEGLLNGINGDIATLGHFLLRPFSSGASPGRTPAVIIIATILGFAVYLFFVALQFAWENRLKGFESSIDTSYPL